MNWKQLISNKRFGMEELHEARKDDRSEFQRDYDRLIFSAPFRRLQNKTQVFPLPGSAYRDWETDRKSTRLNSSHITRSRMPSSA